MTANSFYEIKTVTEDNKQEIVQYLRTFFFKDEPLNAHLELISAENPTCPSLEEFTVRHLNDGINLMAVQNDEIIGICLCVNMEKGKEDPFDCKNKKYNKIVDILEYAEKHCDPFEIYSGCTKGVAVQVISVVANFNGRGIAVKLVQRACEIAKERGLEFMNITTTGVYSAKLAEKLNFELKYTLNYSDYKKNGTVIFKPQLPHTSLKVFLKNL